MRQQLSSTNIEYGKRRRITKREMFLNTMDVILPWENPLPEGCNGEGLDVAPVAIHGYIPLIKTGGNNCDTISLSFNTERIIRNREYVFSFRRAI